MKVLSPKSHLVSYAHVPNSVLAQWEKSHDGLALKKSMRTGPLPDYKDFGHWCLSYFMGEVDRKKIQVLRPYVLHSFQYFSIINLIFFNSL